ncbi:MAG: hypothetical protein ACOZDY_14645 [Pseudomonadota bacterium]
MREAFDLLAARAAASRLALDAELDRALERLNRGLDALAAELAVVHVGPEVGVERRHVHRLVIAPHAWRAGTLTWGLRVCSATPDGGWRAEWSLAGAGRLRKALIVAALPALLRGYAEAVTAAGKQDSAAGRRVLELARAAPA